MEEYSDLKFEGDLSFLNENLEEAKKSFNKDKKVEVQPKVQAAAPENISEKKQSAEYLEKLFNELSAQSSTESQNNSIKTAPQLNVESTDGKKSQLEEMVLSSGVGNEMFEKLKMQLLEMEKEKIIMKYKQDLMMMIMKS